MGDTSDYYSDSDLWTKPKKRKAKPMTRDEKLILAMTEAMILWDRLAETGGWSKYGAIETLHQEGRLHKNDYVGDCPLCDMLASADKKERPCEACPWPPHKDARRCLSNESPFVRWGNHCATIPARKAAAKKVLDLLLSIEF